MGFVRSIGRWAMAALVVNCIIGSGIYGIPSELTGLLGSASPLAMVGAGLATATIMVSFAEVASQFSEPGGPYLYVRTAFGRFAGLQVGWFWLLSVVAAAAAGANLFINYLGGMLPGVERGIWRALAMTLLIALPVVANWIGARTGAALSSALTVAKVLPLALLIVFGLIRFGPHTQLVHASEITATGWKPWLTALLIVLFAYSGFEDAVTPAGEVQNPRRTVPFAIFVGLLVSMVVYTLVQFVAVAAAASGHGDRPLADVASLLLGRGGEAFVEIAAMLSAYGYISATVLSAPRLAVAFAAHGDGPAFLSKLHPRHHTPTLAIVVYASLVWTLALTGTFRWALALSAGASTIYFAAVCASLIRLRKLHPQASALRIPLGPVWAVAGIVFSLSLVSQLDLRESLLMGVTALIATANWGWARRRASRMRNGLGSGGAIGASGSDVAGDDGFAELGE
ncbi:MAG TPA: APC family permease [Candidatus Acidoferrales bacterium]|nr:APC family permease [Candidatus Acidoferrales bacterium]